MKNSNRILSAIILAAGESKRMEGTNKLLLPIGNKTIIRTVVENILAAEPGEAIVVLGHEEEKVKNALIDLPVKFVTNGNFEKGMTTSIQAGVENARGNGYMICLSDMVMITQEEYTLIKNEFLMQLNLDEECIGLPYYQGEKGNPVIFSSHYHDTILRHSEMDGCKAIIQENKIHVHRIEMTTPHVLQDIDFPWEYDKMNEVSP